MRRIVLAGTVLLLLATPPAVAIEASTPAAAIAAGVDTHALSAHAALAPGSPGAAAAPLLPVAEGGADTLDAALADAADAAAGTTVEASPTEAARAALRGAGSTADAAFEAGASAWAAARKKDCALHASLSDPCGGSLDLGEGLGGVAGDFLIVEGMSSFLLFTPVGTPTTGAPEQHAIAAGSAGWNKTRSVASSLAPEDALAGHDVRVSLSPGASGALPSTGHVLATLLALDPDVPALVLDVAAPGPSAPHAEGGARGAAPLPPGVVGARAGDEGAWRLPVGEAAGGALAAGGADGAPGLLFTRQTLALSQAGVGVVPVDAGGIPRELLAAVILGGLACAAPLWALYRKIHRERALESPSRRSIFARIEREPGVTPGELRASTGLHYTSVVHHLRILADFGHVEMRRVGAYLRCFPSAGRTSPVEQNVAAAMRSAPVRALLAQIRGAPGVTPAELARRLDVGRSTVAEHLDRLTGLGLVESAWDGPRRRLRLPDAVGRAVAARTATPSIPAAPDAGLGVS